MLRLIGGLLITGACLWTGWSRRQWYRQRRRTLSQICHGLARMEAELSGRETDTRRLLELLAAGTGEMAALCRRCRALLERLDERPLSALWRQAAESGHLPIREEELALLGRVGDILGRYGGQVQAMLLSHLRQELEHCLAEAREEERRQGKTVLLLGLTAGVTLALLLM
ncbi:MAG: stage III sporulation protein AB [Clostridiales bacterium]|nr:stage III sporulation protein AB [Clostridiales bacterium]